MTELDDLVRTTRFDEIHTARQRVTERRDKLAQARQLNRINNRDAALSYRAVVQGYILELKNLIKNADDTEKDYWNGVKISEFRLSNGRIKTLIGLESLLTEPEVYRVEFEEEIHDARQGKTTETVVTEDHIPFRAIDEAFSTCDEFCADFGLELEGQDVESQPWKFREITDESEQDFDPQEGPV